MSADLPGFLVFGEALTDMVRTGDNQWTSVAGGSCWNVARVAARLGLRTAWCGAVSDDLFGQQIIDQSQSSGLDTRFIQVVDRPPLLAVVPQANPPSYFFIGENSADLAFDETQLPEGWEANCRVAHFGCISLVREPLGSRLVGIAQRLKQRGVKISFDPNYRNLMGPDFPQLFEKMAALADIVKVSGEDLEGIYRGVDPAESLLKVHALAPNADLLYTRGAAGLTLFSEGRAAMQPGFNIELRDSVGAGDACLGGLLAVQHLFPAADIESQARFAAATAAVACAHVGAYAPTPEEVEALLRAS